MRSHASRESISRRRRPMSTPSRRAESASYLDYYEHAARMESEAIARARTARQCFENASAEVARQWTPPLSYYERQRPRPPSARRAAAAEVDHARWPAVRSVDV